MSKPNGLKMFHVEHLDKNIPITEVVPLEYDECLTYYQWAQANPKTRGYLIKIVNEGKRTMYSGKRLKAIGLQKGLPDYYLPLANNNWNGLWIEMKRTNRREDAKDYDQVKWINKLLNIKQYAIFCYGAGDAINITTKYLNNQI